MQDDEARAQIEELKARVEAIIDANHCEDETLQLALIEIGRDRIWRQGLWSRIRYWANVFGALGMIGGGLVAMATGGAWLAATFGIELVRR